MSHRINLCEHRCKTANVVLGNAFDVNEGVVVDTHVRRLSNRLGLTEKKDPEKIEQDLLQIVPEQDRTVFSHLLIFHGRRVCKSRKPDCPNCSLNDIWSLMQKHTAIELRFRSLLTGGVQEVRLERLVTG